jgi:peptidoglycan/LPS O-acetylase OafA/YrhL
MIGYVGGRFLAATDYRYVTVVYASTYLVLAGFLVCALVLLAHSFQSRRPLILQLLAAIAVAFAVLLVLFPYSRAVAYPDAALAASATLLLVIGWKDLCDPRAWKRGSPDPTNPAR